MQRRIIAGSVLTLIMSAFVVIGTTLPAYAINRCGLAYSQTTPAQPMYYDESPPIQPYRLRIKPSTPHDVCIEFLTVKPGWETNGHVIRFYDYAGQPASKICGLRVCRWHTGDNRFYVEVEFYARRTDRSTDWEKYHGEKVYEIAS